MFSLPQVQKAFATILEDLEKKGENLPSRGQQNVGGAWRGILLFQPSSYLSS